MKPVSGSYAPPGICSMHVLPEEATSLPGMSTALIAPAAPMQWDLSRTERRQPVHSAQQQTQATNIGEPGSQPHWQFMNPDQDFSTLAALV